MEIAVPVLAVGSPKHTKVIQISLKNVVLIKVEDRKCTTQMQIKQFRNI